MSDATATTPATTQTPTRLPDLTAEFASVLAFENIVKDLCAQRRTMLYDRLAEVREETGSKSFQARDTEGSVMAEFILKDSAEAFKVADADAFATWVIENFPTEVEVTYSLKPDSIDWLVEEHPEHADMTATVRAAFTKGFLTKKRLKAAGDDVIDTETGQIVDGVTHYPSEPATSFTTSWKDGGKEAAAGALLEGAAERLFSSYVGSLAALEAGQ